MNVTSAWWKNMRLKGGLIIAVMGLVFSSTLLVAESSESSHSHAHHEKKRVKKRFKGPNRYLELAIHLESKFWSAVQNKNKKQYSKLLSVIFQGLSPAGAYDRREQIDGLKQANLIGFGINHPVATNQGNDLVFAYDLVAVSGEIVSGPQVSVWRQVKDRKGKWEMISHSYAPFLPIAAPI